MADGALAGIRVLECCNMVTGPYCTKILADLGADVVKVEEPFCGDKARSRGPYPNDIPHPERSGLFLLLNTNKAGITLSLETSRGKELFFELVQTCDLLVQDYPPSDLQRLGLDYATLGSWNQKLVVCSISPFGQTGPYRNYKSYALNTLHAGGEGYLVPGGTEYIDRPPVKVANYYADFSCGLIAAIAAMSALYQTAASGEGQHVDVSKQEAAMFFQRWGVVRYANENRVISRATEGYWFGGILPCKDGFTVFWPVQAHEWERLKSLMGNPEWTEEPRFKDFGQLVLNGQEANAYVLEWLMKYTGEELYAMGQAAGVPFGMVRTAEDLFSSEQLKAREFFVEIEHPAVGRLKYPSAPYKLSRTPWRVARPAPLLGQDNEAVYCGRLGHTKDQLARFRAAGIV